jgi:D-methionine transport system ATP-binding protein
MSPLIHVDTLSKEYTPGVWALRRVSFAVREGEVFGIIGQSGAGKSTLIRTLARLVPPTEGRVFVRGQDIWRMKREELRAFRKTLGMIFQHFNLLSSRTAAGNIAYPLEIAGLDAEERVQELLTLVGLEDRGDAYPARLSGGEKQRVGIARALATRPQVLLCDEATSALDPKTTQEILALLKTLNRTLGLTIVLITHEMEVIKQICHKVAVLERGELVETGPVEEVFAAPQHPTTKRLLQLTPHDLPPDLISHPRRRLLRLSFKGEAASKPIISHLVRTLDVTINILSGWIDHLRTMRVGTLIVEIEGSPENVQRALNLLREQGVYCEAL